ncbi:MAG: glycoside hydrolase family 97 protein [Sphingobacteriales bacterium]|nr:MAG: glycoside hydrolase family 97 protein [Sphingobacteriales bacterium]
MQIKTIVAFCCLCLCSRLTAQSNIRLSSPDGHIVFSFSVENHKTFYSIEYNKQALITKSSLNLIFADGEPLGNCKLSAVPKFSSAIESYHMIVGKASSINQPYKKLIIPLAGEKYNINIEVKAFNDGLAFRYVFPKQANKSNFILLEEQSQFKLSGNPVIKALQLPGFTTSHEGLYTTAPISQIKNDTLMDMPALFEFPGNIYMAITEAALLDYAGMYLVKRNGILTSQLSPLPNQSAIKVKAAFPHQSPWRVMMISNRPGALVESTILTSLNNNSSISDWSWLKPGTSTFPWWNGTVIPDSVKGGNNFETNKYYIDFCAANHISYHTVVEYGGHEWYTNDGEGYQPGKHNDITKPVEGLDMKQICDYGKKMGVGIRVWTHWKALYPKLDTAFALFEKWGLSGMMVDFMDRDDQEMVNIQTEILEKAAKHHLHIQFHGAYKPTGTTRMYPNEFTREGAMNYEYDKWEKLVTPDADVNIAFTRLLAGSTDYHLGGFNALPVDKFYPQNIKPYVMGTRCHMLAMYVVLENSLSMVCDYPDAYIGQPGFEVIQQMPTTWDETKVPAGMPDQFITVARRKKDKWFVGTINNNESKEVTIPLNFLGKGNYKVEIFSDAIDANENANHLTKQMKIVNSNTKLKLSLAPGGGNVIILTK